MNPRLRTSLFDVAFCLTGVGTALLGATLPATLHQWNLTDANGGLLLLAGWGGSTAGALFARGHLRRSAGVGLLLSCAALLALSQQHPIGLAILYLVYGTGLGLTMTAISILRSREVAVTEADLILNRLNLLWAAGACVAPALSAHSLRLLSIATLYRGLGGVFAVVAILILWLSARKRELVLTARSMAEPMLQWAPLRFGLFAAASVGLESAIGSWLTTYTQRSSLGVSTAVSANSAFWVGLLLSRGVHSLKTAAWLHTHMVRVLHVLAVGVGTTCLLTFPTGTVILIAGFLCGVGLGPLYPYILSITLPRYRSVAIFVIAGIGASVVPWLTGAVSSAENSLRIGLLVPAAVFVVLALSAALIVTRERTLTSVKASSTHA